MKKIPKLLFFLLPAGWLAINWFLAAALGLDPDEAYYWIYSQQLSWGYFDHPPVIALLIFLGKSLAGGELGVRLLMPLLSLGTFLLVWDLAGRPKDRHRLGLLVLLFTAMPLLQVYAFVATPDAPLLFFSALFFWVYRQFCRRPCWHWALAFGLVMAALLYSKYHGVLLIFFTLLSNFRLWRNPYFYVAGITGLILFFPHLYWQYTHDFPSFRYHLSGRDDPYELKHTLNYLLNQFLIFSPLLFPFILGVLWKYKGENRLERAFPYIVLGFWGFFFYTTFKGHVEPQWTVILSLPFILMLYRAAGRQERLGRWIKWMAALSAILLVVLRIVLILPDGLVKTPFNNHQWVKALQAATGGKPLVFQDSYRNPALYQFYTGERAYTFTDNCYRHNQYDLLDWEAALQGRTVWLAGQTTWKNPEAQTLFLPGNTFKLKMAEDLQISQKVILSVDLPADPWAIGDSLFFKIQLYNPYEHDIYPGRGSLPLSIKERYGIMDCLDDSSTLEITDPPAVWPAGQTITLQAKMKVSDRFPPGSYSFALCIQTGDLPPAYSGSTFIIELAEKKKEQMPE